MCVYNAVSERCTQSAINAERICKAGWQGFADLNPQYCFACRQLGRHCRMPTWVSRAYFPLKCSWFLSTWTWQDSLWFSCFEALPLSVMNSKLHISAATPAFCRDYQELKLQEHVQKLAVGTIPRSMWVVLEDDLVDGCKPGDDVTICGTVMRRWKSLSVDVSTLNNQAHLWSYMGKHTFLVTCKYDINAIQKCDIRC